MKLFDRLTKERYQYKNNISSVKFIDYMITDLNESVPCEICREMETVCRMVRNLLRYTRYEAANPYAFHKCVPAARNVHVNEAYLLYQGDVIRYNCKSDIFEDVNHVSGREKECRLILTAELWRIMKFYGEFGVVLPLLDAGHLLAEMKLFLEKENMTEAAVIYGAGEKEDYALFGISPKSNPIVLTIDLSKAVSFGERSSVIGRQYERSMNYDEEVFWYEAAAAFLTAPEGFSKKAFCLDGQRMPVFEKTLFRESAHNRIGLCSMEESVSGDMVHELTEKLALCMNHFMEEVRRYGVYILYREEKEEFLLHIREGRLLQKEPVVCDRNILLHDTARMIDMESMPIVLYISYLYDNTLSEKENIYNAHLGAGEINQYFALGVSEKGMFARPMRNFEDEAVEELFHTAETGERFIYSLIAGTKNTVNHTTYFI